ncbi:helix-turn-helix domain-containing protein [Rhodobacterales bacterium HKCCE2091]|nr:helix-turn-helix domain-containing protein [Rhodobacterales bacterium HKCCE2091]
MTDASDGETDWYSGDTSTFGDRLAAAREAAGLTQSDLSRRAGVSLEAVEEWENDQTEPRANTLQRVAGILGVSLMWLMAGEGEGLESGAEALDVSEPFRELIAEIRELRGEQARLGERLGRLEKRLRLAAASIESA